MRTQLAIVIPAYKINYLENVLESLCLQTCNDYTLYVFDDASPDDVAGVVKHFETKITIEYVRFESNLGRTDLVGHWNRCLKYINDEWTWFICDDDVIEPDCVDSFHRSLEIINNYDLVRFNTSVIDESGRQVRKNVNHPVSESSLSFTMARLRNERSSYLSEYIFRTKVCRELGGFINFARGWASDDATWASISKVNGIYTIEDHRVYWRMSTFNITNDHTDGFEKIDAVVDYANFINNLYNDQDLADEGIGRRSFERLIDRWATAQVRRLGRRNGDYLMYLSSYVKKKNESSSVKHVFEVLRYATRAIYHRLFLINKRVAPRASRSIIRVLAKPAFSNRSVNPYNALLYEQCEKFDVQTNEISALEFIKGNYEIVHLHWPEDYLYKRGLAYLLGYIALMCACLMIRMRGKTLVWTAHNIEPHDLKGSARFGLHKFTFDRFVDGCIYMNESDVQALKSRRPLLSSATMALIPHGTYKGAYPSEISEKDARAKLGLPRELRIVAFIGKIRKYKNVEGLIRIAPALVKRGVGILIAGDCETDYCVQLESMPEMKAVELFHPRHLAAEEMQNFIAAAELIILPYGKVTNSGSALLALSFDKPVLVPRNPAFESLRSNVGEEWVHLYENSLNESDVMKAINTERRTEIPAPLLHYDNKHIAALHNRFYRSLVDVST